MIPAARACRRGCSPAPTEECQAMLDVFMLVIGIGFFTLAAGYAFACERL
jgi:hypothetical protein